MKIVMRIMARLLSGQWNSVDILQAGLGARTLQHDTMKSRVTDKPSSDKHDDNFASNFTCDSKSNQDDYSITSDSNGVSSLVEEARILYKSDNFVVVNKRYDLKVNSDDPNESFTVAQQLSRLYSHDIDHNTAHGFRFIHRLDYATSGCLCIALSKASSRWGHKAFAKRYVTKHYVALVRGHLDADTQRVVDIDVAIGNDASVTDIYRMCTGWETPLNDMYDKPTNLPTLGSGLNKANSVKGDQRLCENPTELVALDSKHSFINKGCDISTSSQSTDTDFLHHSQKKHSDHLKLNMKSSFEAVDELHKDVLMFQACNNGMNRCMKGVSTVDMNGDTGESKELCGSPSHDSCDREIIVNNARQDNLSISTYTREGKELQLENCAITSALETNLDNISTHRNISSHVESSAHGECVRSTAVGQDEREAEGSGSSVGVCVNPRTAQTKLVLLQHGTYDGLPVSKVLLIPHTGRTHQLRVHCRHIGHPVVGDYMYSARRDVNPYRMMLHSMRLVIPMKRETIDITACDPFTPQIDSLWRPSTTYHTYQQYLIDHPIRSYP